MISKYIEKLIKIYYTVSMKTKTAIILSLIIHLTSFFLMSNQEGQQGAGTEQTQNEEQEGEGNSELAITVIEMPELNYQMSTPEMEEDPEGTEPKKKDYADVECKDTYGGIGVQQSFMTGELMEVFEGYPAWDAGLRPGDRIETLTGEDIRGEPGTVLILVVQKKGSNQKNQLKITRGAICYERD